MLHYNGTLPTELTRQLVLTRKKYHGTLPTELTRMLHYNGTLPTELTRQLVLTGKTIMALYQLSLRGCCTIMALYQLSLPDSWFLPGKLSWHSTN
ncbi:hypothetical protein DPMN_105321 [Dreissena polymorpha]|nr:hypothetical protein DPMN_105321 [Dreissena polymorpha]